ncbi:outer membrane protein assembly factor BamB family protein [Amycolatopsis sp. H20-H5]|uniref:outer membrane protein assembly factor BamB family protein n=1 Tax=Amycolatopsis sp. H20-H5 TaxID=3046309 RepID=UPI002DC0509D|nr:PQQ-binding-like beta-propeller repeat protein [Amycolatopsis sp. H20-H5]MEC3982386.1 PQQ-binding-like beta-propeller repeat protein [Amycolatopsis sp. H20-H5]
MFLPEEAIERLLTQVKDISSGILDGFSDSMMVTLSQLVADHAVLGPLLHAFKLTPTDTSSQHILKQNIERELVEDAAFATQFHRIVISVRTDYHGENESTQHVLIGRDARSPKTFSAGGHLVNGNFNHIGDRIRNIHKSNGGKLGIGISLAIIVAVVILLVALTSSADGSDPSTTPSSAAIPAASSPTGTPASSEAGDPLPELPTGTEFYRPTSGEDFVSGGQVLGVMDENPPQAPVFRAIDIRTGKQHPGFPVPTEASSGGPGTHIRCAFTVVSRQDGMNMLLTVDRMQTPAEGTVPSTEKQSLVALNALSGEPLWTVDSRTVERPDSPVAIPTSGCRLDPASTLRPSNVWFSSDRLHALVTFGTDQNVVVDLQDGAHREVPEGAVLLGNWVLVPVSKTSDGSYDPRYLDVVNPSDGTNAGRVDDRVAAIFVKQLSASPDGETLLNTAANPDEIAYSLPTGKALWKSSHSKTGLIDGDVTNTAIIDGTTGGGASSGQKLLAYSVRSGDRLWNISNLNGYCGKFANRAYVLANGQLATLDLASGKQLAYDPTVQKCPEIQDGVMSQNTPTGVVIIRL